LIQTAPPNQDLDLSLHFEKKELLHRLDTSFYQESPRSMRRNFNQSTEDDRFLETKGPLEPFLRCVVGAVIANVNLFVLG
jgi:hypothetical protein